MSDVSSTAYFDESRVDQSHKFAVVAGFFNTSDMWEVFEKKWKTAAKDIPDSEIKKYFRHRPSVRESELDKKRYRDSLILAQVMRDYALWPISVILEREKFQPYFDALKGQEKLAPLLSSAYTVCSFSCCVLLDEMARKRKVRHEWTPVKVVFDKGNPDEHWLEKGYESYFASHSETYLKRASVFEYDDDLIPLKAADSYAWLLARKYNEHEELEALKVLRETGHGVWIEREITGEKAAEILKVIESQREENRQKAKSRNA